MKHTNMELLVVPENTQINQSSNKTFVGKKEEKKKLDGLNTNVKHKVSTYLFLIYLKYL